MRIIIIALIHLESGFKLFVSFIRVVEILPSEANAATATVPLLGCFSAFPPSSCVGHNRVFDKAMGEREADRPMG